jgi:mRNA interferase MazF
MKQGDIVLVPFPFTNQQGSVRRPALVVSGSLLNNTADIMLVQITSNNRQDNFSISIDNHKDLTVPLNQISEIRCNKILIAEKSIIIKSISSVKPGVVNKVIDKIKDILKP